MKLSSLKDLKVIKKDLEPEPEAKPSGNQPRCKTVVHRSKEEEKARSEGLVKGQKVRMMDSSDVATIVGFGKDFYELEMDGLVFRAGKGGFLSHQSGGRPQTPFGHSVKAFQAGRRTAPFGGPAVRPYCRPPY